MIFVFAGTSEGRSVCEYLDSLQIEHMAFVATDYGSECLKALKMCRIIEGRKNQEEILSYIREYEPQMVIDATHPFAVEVSENIKVACKELSREDIYVRLSRNIANSAVNQGMQDRYNIEFGYLRIKVSSTEEAIKSLSNIKGNILLTTGVKTLADYMSIEAIRDRIYARIIPSMESFEKAIESGISPRRIIAMEGPFSMDMNLALIDQLDIKVLVTKNSGKRGGFDEKLEACRRRNIPIIVIEKEITEHECSLEEVKRLIDVKLSSNQISNDQSAYIKESTTGINKDIVIAGIGAGNDESMTVAVFNAIKSADVLIGAKRMIELGRGINPNAVIYQEYMADRVAEIVRDSDKDKIVILMSGDTGFYSGAEGIRRSLIKLSDSGSLNSGMYNNETCEAIIEDDCEADRTRLVDGLIEVKEYTEGILKKEIKEYKLRILPGISSLSYFASKIAVPYSDAYITSIHGRNAAYRTELADRIINSENIVFSLVSGSDDLKELIKSLKERKSDAYIYIGYNLGYQDERIISGKVSDLKDSDYDKEGLYIIGSSPVGDRG